MRPTKSPPLVPGFDVTVYIVLDDFGRAGRAYREIDEEQADLETLIRNLIGGQYEKPVRIVAFNSAEGWSKDVTEDVAREVQARADASGDELPFGIKAFVEYTLDRVS